MPKWSTPPRREFVLSAYKRFADSWSIDFWTGKLENPKLEAYLRPIIKDWVSDDRQATAYLNKLLRNQLHRIPEIGSLRGQFNFVSREIYHDSQPQYYFEALGINGLNYKPFARIRIASAFTRLHVDISEPLNTISKHKRRKAIRYGKGLPIPIQRQVEELCNLAIARYLSK